MADIVVTGAAVEVLNPSDAEIMKGVAAVAVTQGQTAYQTTSGTWGVGACNTSGKQQIRGIYLNAAGAGQAVSILKRGLVGGYTLAGAYDSAVYGSDTAGALADAAGTVNALVGRVVAMPDRPTYTKVLYINCGWNTTFV
jgi:hypothetical protein